MANQNATCSISTGAVLTTTVAGGGKQSTAWAETLVGKDWIEDYLSPQQSTK